MTRKALPEQADNFETPPLEDEYPADDFPDPIRDAASALFGIPYLFPYQRLAVANILEAAAAAGIPIRWPSGGEASLETAEVDKGAVEEDVDIEEDRSGWGRQIVILPTGAGKSLCFQLPASLMDRPTLVIYPLLGLMSDQARRLQERGFSPALLRGGQDKAERDALWEKIRTGESKFIITNPETLLSPQVFPRLHELNAAHIVIDEAHCVSEWGESFRPAYLEIHRIIEAANAPLVTAFTATASADVLGKISAYIFGGGEQNRILGNPDRSNIAYAALGCVLRDLATRDLLLTYPRPAIVFCSSREGTRKLAGYLSREFADRGLPWRREIKFYHAGLEREEKRLAEEWYLRSSQGILIATCAFGMGIDKPDIRTVIHRDCPPSIEAYLQESGRAGRDGQPSRAFLLWGPGDEAGLRRCSSEANALRLRALHNYARDTTGCRREALVRLLDYQGSGESPESDCCDVCSGRAVGVWREEPVLLDFFRRNRLGFSLTEAARELAASEVVSWSEEDAKEAIRALIKKGLLGVSKNPLWKGKLRPIRGAKI